MSDKKTDPSSKVLIVKQKRIPGPGDKASYQSRKHLQHYIDKLADANKALLNTKAQLESACNQLNEVGLKFNDLPGEKTGKTPQEPSNLLSENGQSSLNMILDNTDECFLLLDKDLRIKTYNSMAQNKAMELVGKPFKEGDYILDLAEPERVPMLSALYQDILNGNTRNYEYKMEVIPGMPVIYSLKYSPVKNEQNQVIAIMMIAKDITQQKALEEEQKKAQELIRDSEEKYRMLFYKSPLPMYITEVGTMKFLEVNDAMISHYGYTQEEFLSMTAFHIRSAEERIRLMTSRFGISSKLNARGNWKHLKKNGEELIADITTYEIDFKGTRALLVIINDITERLRAEEQKEFERKNREAMINTTMDLIWSVDTELKLLDANKAFINYIITTNGFAPIPGENILNSAIFNSEQIDFWEILYRKALGGSSFKKELHLEATGNSEESWLEISFNPIYNENKIIGLACYARNVSESRRSQCKLITINKKLETAQQIAKLGYWELDLTHKSIYWSSEVYRIWGRIPDSFQPNYEYFYETVHPEDRAAFDLKVKSTLEGGLDLDVEHRILLPDGTIKYIHKKGSIVKDENGKVLRLEGTVQDITERKLIQESLKLSKERYDIVSKATSDAIWDWNLVTGKIYRSKEGLKKVYGFDDNEPIEMIDQWVDRIHPDDRESVDAMIANILDPHDQFTFSMEYRFRKRSGEYSYVLDRGYIIKDENGKPIRMIGAAQDITERKKAELQISDSERRYRNLFEQNLSGVYRTTISGKMINCNKAFANMVGYDTVEEVLLANTNDFYYHQADRQKFIVDLIRKKHLQNYEGLLKKKDGSPLYVISNISYIQEEGTAEAYCEGVIIDITERKNAAAALKSSYDELLVNQALLKKGEKLGMFGSWHLDLESGAIQWSDQACNIYGYEPGTFEPSYNAFLEHVHPEDLDFVLGVFAEKRDYALSRKMEFRIIDKKGVTKFIRAEWMLETNDMGKPIKAVGFNMDITAVKRTEEELKKLSLIARETMNSVIITDRSGNVQWVNEAFVKITGYELNEVMGKKPGHFLQGPETNPVIVRYMRQKISAGKEFNCDLLNYSRSGTKYWIRIQCQPQLDTSGKVMGFFAMQTDITREKEAEIATTNSEKRFRALIENSTDGITIIDKNKVVLDISPSALRILGYSKEAYIGADRSSFIHPDDQHKVNASLEEVLKDANSSRSIEYRFKKADGSYTWIESSFHNQLDEPALNAIVINFRDITQRKNTEENVTLSEERYRYLFNNNPAVIIIWDMETYSILEVNDAAIQQYGYTREVFLKKTMLDIKVSEEVFHLEQFLGKIRLNNKFKEVKTQKHVNSTGDLMHMHITAQAIPYKGKNVILALATNVTEKVLLKDNLEKERKKKQQEITAAVITAQENERQQLGRELHDNVNQILASSRIYLGMAKKQSENPHPFITESEQLIKSAIDEIRNLSHSLIPPSLSESELIGALDNIIAITGKSSSVKIISDWKGFKENELSDNLKLSIYRIVQEQFSNISKYAHAQNVKVKLTHEKEKIWLHIKDDGVGFDTNTRSAGVGLLNIRTRASLYNGKMQIISSPGTGCELTVCFN